MTHWSQGQRDLLKAIATGYIRYHRVEGMTPYFADSRTSRRVSARVERLRTAGLVWAPTGITPRPSRTEWPVLLTDAGREALRVTT